MPAQLCFHMDSQTSNQYIGPEPDLSNKERVQTDCFKLIYAIKGKKGSLVRIVMKNVTIFFSSS